MVEVMYSRDALIMSPNSLNERDVLKALSTTIIPSINTTNSSNTQNFNITSPPTVDPFLNFDLIGVLTIIVPAVILVTILISFSCSKRYKVKLMRSRSLSYSNTFAKTSVSVEDRYRPYDPSSPNTAASDLSETPVSPTSILSDMDYVFEKLNGNDDQVKPRACTMPTGYVNLPTSENNHSIRGPYDVPRTKYNNKNNLVQYDVQKNNNKRSRGSESTVSVTSVGDHMYVDLIDEQVGATSEPGYVVLADSREDQDNRKTDTINQNLYRNLPDNRNTETISVIYSQPVISQANPERKDSNVYMNSIKIKEALSVMRES